MPTRFTALAGYLFRLRFRQINRILNEVGLVRIMLLLFIVSPYAWMLFKTTWDGMPNGWLVTAVFMLLGHTRRKDGAIFRIAGFRPVFVFLIEYLAVSIPFLVSFGVHANLMWLGIAAAFPVLLALLPSGFVKKIRGARRRKSPFPAHQFEWISGFRKHGVLLVAFFLAGTGLSFLIWATPVAVVLISGMISSFYYENEPAQVLQASPDSPGAFLRKKVIIAIRNTTLFTAPPLLVYVFLNLEMWPLGIAISLVSLWMVATAVIVKYAFFSPGTQRPRNALMVGLGVFAWIFPFFLPPVIALLIRFWQQAKSRITPFLYAQS